VLSHQAAKGEAPSVDFGQHHSILPWCWLAIGSLNVCGAESLQHSKRHFQMKMLVGHRTARLASIAADFSKGQQSPAQNQPYRRETQKSTEATFEQSDFIGLLRTPICDEVNSTPIARFCDSGFLPKFETDAEIGDFFRKNF
jgi:hypothetical protein